MIGPGRVKETILKNIEHHERAKVAGQNIFEDMLMTDLIVESETALQIILNKVSKPSNDNDNINTVKLHYFQRQMKTTTWLEKLDLDSQVFLA